MPPDDQPSAARLDRLEESQAFAQHSSDQLSTELTELNRRVLDLTTRLGRLESRLGGLIDRVGEFEDRGTEPPPHAAGPDIPKDPL